MKTWSILAFMFLTPVVVGACSDSSAGLGPGKGSGGTGGSGTDTDNDSGGPDLLRIVTDKGAVRGSAVGATRAFLGIPYAKPPIGELRWKRPAPATAWTEVRDATAIRPACPQIDFITSMPLQGTSEDCLTLNVWTPASPPSSSPTPTLFWIHGGGFTIGSGGDPSFDGRVLSEATGAVVVTINYRLGPLGFLALPTLATEDPAYPSAGMYGFEDQRAALLWTKANIAAFGGDPRNVTIFGESAGGISVCLHVLSEKSGGLFQRAIIESGPCTLGTSKTEKEAEVLGDMLASAVQCADPTNALECLRSKTAEEIVSAIKPTQPTLTGGGLGWYPNVDGWNLRDTPAKLLETGAFSRIPTVLGANKDEGTVFFAPGAPMITETEFLSLMDLYFPGRAAEIVAQYTSAVYGTVKDAAEEALGDGLFVCPTRVAAGALSQAGIPTYLYQFEHAVTSPMFPGFGAFHSSEIPFIFGNPYWDIVLGADEQVLAKTMRGYWGRMAKWGNPNGEGAPDWPQYQTSTDQSLVLDLTISTSTGLKADRCNFWADLAH